MIARYADGKCILRAIDLFCMWFFVIVNCIGCAAITVAVLILVKGIII